MGGTMRWAELRMCRFWAGGISSFPFSRAREYRLLRRLHLIPLEILAKFGNEDEEELVDVNEESSRTQDLSTEPLDSYVKTAIVEKKNRPKKDCYSRKLLRKLLKQT
jgi:hypothetical protein